MNADPGPDKGSIVKGFGLLLALHAAAAAICCSIALVAEGDASGGFTILLFLGGVQILYVAPAAVILSSKRRSLTLKGLLIGAGVTFLLNAACAGVVLSSIR